MNTNDIETFALMVAVHIAREDPAYFLDILRNNFDVELGPVELAEIIEHIENRGR